MKFENKAILITGASSGMGEAIVRKLAEKGCKLAIFARREENLKKIANEIKSDKTTCIYKKCDVSNEKNVKEAVDFTINKFGRIDAAILTAGILVPNPIQTFDSSIIKNTLDINFMGNVYFIERLLKVMKKQKNGTIAAVSTLPDRRGVPGWGAYGASKAALSWLIESLRAEARQKYNINFITIKPGSVLTPMIKNYYRHGAITAEKAAELIIKGIKKGKTIIQFPFKQVLLVRMQEFLPPAPYDNQDIELMKGDGYPQVDEE